MPTDYRHIALNNENSTWLTQIYLWICPNMSGTVVNDGNKAMNELKCLQRASHLAYRHSSTVETSTYKEKLCIERGSYERTL